jgi:HEAT repeat protein
MMTRVFVLIAMFSFSVGCWNQQEPAAKVRNERPSDDSTSSTTEGEAKDPAADPLHPDPSDSNDVANGQTSEPAATETSPLLTDHARRMVALRTDDDPRLRIEADTFLAELGGDALPLLYAAARDADPKLRAGAAYALLEKFDGYDKASSELFLRMLSDEDATVRGMALQAVGRFTEEDALRAVDPLAAILAGQHEADHRRGLAARLLGNVRSEPAFEALREAAMKDATARVRTAALAAAMATAPNEEAMLILLRNRLSSDKELSVLKTAVFQLQKLGPSAAPAAGDLASLLGHEDELLRAHAARCLAAIGPASADTVIDQLDSSDPRRVLGAMAALVQIEPPPYAAIAPLQRLKSSPDAAIRQGAEAALKRIPEGR